MNSEKPHDPTEAFTAFWNDAMSRMNLPGMGGMGVQPPSAEDAARQMQRVFLDAWAKYCDDVMRSEPFLEMLKKSMDNAMTFKKQVNDFLAQAHKEGQAPARSDVDDVAVMVKRMEGRLMQRVEELEARLAEQPRAAKTRPVKTKTAAAAKKKVAATAKATKKSKKKAAKKKTAKRR